MTDTEFCWQNISKLILNFITITTQGQLYKLPSLKHAGSGRIMITLWLTAVEFQFFYYDFGNFEILYSGK